MAFAEGTTTEQGKQPYKYNGKELDQSHGLNQYDYSARYYDPGYNRFTTQDPLSEKFYNWSPYVYVGNNPINAIDPDGKDILLIIWATQSGSVGHAGIAVSNYKMVSEKVFENGKTFVQTKMVPDGTYTYRDLWPSEKVGAFNFSDDVSSS